MNNITKTKILKSKTFKPEFLIEYVIQLKLIISIYSTTVRKKSIG